MRMTYTTCFGAQYSPKIHTKHQTERVYYSLTGLLVDFAFGTKSN